MRRYRYCGRTQSFGAACLSAVSGVTAPAVLANIPIKSCHRLVVTSAPACPHRIGLGCQPFCRRALCDSEFHEGHCLDRPPATTSSWCRCSSRKNVGVSVGGRRRRVRRLRRPRLARSPERPTRQPTVPRSLSTCAPCTLQTLAGARRSNPARHYQKEVRTPKYRRTSVRGAMAHSKEFECCPWRPRRAVARRIGSKSTVITALQSRWRPRHLSACLGIDSA